MSATTVRQFLENVVSGGAYGATAVILSHPFDTVKTRQQAMVPKQDESQFDFDESEWKEEDEDYTALSEAHALPR